MTAYPELIGGMTERLDTEIMRAAPGKLVSKVGAEGVYTVGVLPCDGGRKAWGWPSRLKMAMTIELGLLL